MRMILLRAALVLGALAVEAAGQGVDGWRSYGAPLIEVDVAGHSGFLLKPAGRASGEWVWYAPAFRGRHPNASNAWLFERLLAKGVAVAGVDVGESYGSPAGEALLQQFYTIATERYGLSKRVSLLAQSRGGLMLYGWAANHADRVRAIGGIYPVCDLRSYPGIERAHRAFGITVDELSRRLREFNPTERLGPLAAHKVPILHLHGDADRVVPLEANSAELARRYRHLGGKIVLEVVAGKGHQEIPEFFESKRLLEFLLSGGER